MGSEGGLVGADGNAYPGELTPSATKASIVVAMGGFLFGYDIGISGGVTFMDAILVRFFPSLYRKITLGRSTNEYCQYDNGILTLFTASLFLATLLSSRVASTVTRQFGCRNSILFGGALFFLGALLNGFARSIWMFILARMLLGFGVGIL